MVHGRCFNFGRLHVFAVRIFKPAMIENYIIAKCSERGASITWKKSRNKGLLPPTK